MPYSQPGQKNGRAKLTADLVKLLRRKWNAGEGTIKELRAEHAPNVGFSTVAQAIRGHAWKNLE
jgi:hypothetical protein